MTHGYKPPSITPTFTGPDHPAATTNSLTRENWLWVADGKPTKFRPVLAEQYETMDGPEWKITVEGGWPMACGLTPEGARRLAACWNACRDMSIERLEASAENTLLDQLFHAAKNQSIAVGRLVEAKRELEVERARGDSFLALSKERDRQILALSNSLNEAEGRRMDFNERYLLARKILIEKLDLDLDQLFMETAQNESRI